MAATNASTKIAEINAAAKPQLRLTRPSPAYWRVTIDNPPINVMGPQMVREFQEIMVALEAAV
jgi:enoyl-CoA hydratase/carnithine racemase